MATTNETEQVYRGHESIGVAVSLFPSIPSQALAHRALPFPTGDRCLRYALVDLRLEHVRNPWGMYLFNCDHGTRA
jgi:hypothetical protein